MDLDNSRRETLENLLHRIEDAKIQPIKIVLARECYENITKYKAGGFNTVIYDVKLIEVCRKYSMIKEKK